MPPTVHDKPAIDLTQNEIQAEIKRLKTDLWHRGFYFLAAFALVPFDTLLFFAYWNWFVVRLGLPHLSYLLAFALWMMWCFLLSPKEKPTLQKGWPKDPKTVWPSMFQAYANRVFTLVIGASIHVFGLRR